MSINLGQAHRCPGCGKKFYDLNKPEKGCPSCSLSRRPAGDSVVYNTFPLLKEGLPHHDSEPYRDNCFRLLDNLTEGLSEEGLKVHSDDPDGRINAKLDEGDVVKAIKNIYPSTNLHAEGYQIDAPESRNSQKQIRSWYDIKFYRQHSGYDIEEIPADIKSSVMAENQSDNSVGKSALYYALTGRIPDSTLNHYGPYVDALMDHANPEAPADAFFIGVNKLNTRFVRAYSLKTLAKLTPNATPSNWPFQVCWEKNHKRIYRSPEEAFRFLCATFYESVNRGLGDRIRLHRLLENLKNS